MLAMASSACPFSTLPTELAFRIVASAGENAAPTLCRLRMVSKQFRELVNQVDSVIWWLLTDVGWEGEMLLFLRSAPKVRKLTIYWDFHRTPSPCLGYLTGALMLAPQLRKLSLHEKNNQNGGYQTSSDLIKQLCPSLHTLDFSPRRGKLDEAIHPRCHFPCLKELHLYLTDCELSSNFLESLVNSCPILESALFTGAPEGSLAQLHCPSLRSLKIEGYGAWFAELNAPNLLYFKLDTVANQVIDAPRLQTVALGNPEGGSGGCLTIKSNWRLKHLKLMGDWQIEHFESVLSSCLEVAALDLEMARIAELGLECALRDHPFAQCILGGLGCVKEIMVDSEDTFGQQGEQRIYDHTKSLEALTSLDCLKVFFNYGLDALDFEICEDLIALSPKLERFDMLIEAEGDFEATLSPFIETLAEKWPHLVVKVDRGCNISKLKDKWHLEKSGRPEYFDYFSE